MRRLPRAALRHPELVLVQRCRWPRGADRRPMWEWFDFLHAHRPAGPRPAIRWPSCASRWPATAGSTRTGGRCRPTRSGGSACECLLPYRETTELLDELSGSASGVGADPLDRLRWLVGDRRGAAGPRPERRSGGTRRRRSISTTWRAAAAGRRRRSVDPAPAADDDHGPGRSGSARPGARWPPARRPGGGPAGPAGAARTAARPRPRPTRRPPRRRRGRCPGRGRRARRRRRARRGGRRPRAPAARPRRRGAAGARGRSRRSGR